MVDIVRPDYLPREFLQVVIFLVRCMVRADDPELSASLLCAAELHRDRVQCSRPGDRIELAVNSHQRRLQAVGVIVKIESIAALDAQKLAVDPRAVAIVPADDTVVADSKRGLRP